MQHKNRQKSGACPPYSLSTEVSADLGDVPWLNIAYEGPGDPTEDLKIEAFVDQAVSWQAKRGELVL